VREKKGKENPRQAGPTSDTSSAEAWKIKRVFLRGGNEGARKGREGREERDLLSAKGGCIKSRYGVPYGGVAAKKRGELVRVEP